jgi:hypothetical protein
MKYLDNPAPSKRKGTTQKGARKMAKRKAKRTAARRSSTRKRSTSGKRRRVGFRRNPPGRAVARRGGGVFNDLLMLPVRGLAVVAGMAAARAATRLIPAPAAGTPARSPLLPFGVGLATAAGLQFVGSALKMGPLPRELFSLAAGGAAGNAGKNLITAYYPEAQEFLGRHDDVMYFTAPRQLATMRLSSYARPGTLNSYARPMLSSYPGGSIPAGY